ncbi:putative mitochondrial protein [Sesamum angolense]|uniref:Mitochondrial protein n=1 Tax=Sesamum angolense TaxID=2727404 RepID=A0AAE1WIY4_9LAMI|nr:putative mitochondrial protein [Sesamum angolense]
MVQHVPMNCSDHVALVICLRDSIRHDTHGARPWRFEAAWLQWNECEKNWSKTTLQTDKNRVKLSDSKLRRLLRERVTPEVSEEIARIRLELEGIAAHDETRWKQRSKVLWLREGDRNIGFFHKKASQRFKTNSIRKIRNSEGTWVTTEEGIQQCISSHCGSVYASNCPQPDAIAKGTEHLHTVVDARMGEDLLQPYTAFEVKKVLFQIAHLKSPGPDATLNATHLVLILKCKNPEDLSQFRPIILCNVSRQGWMAIKLDVSKAYDKPERGLRQGDPLSPYIFLLCTESFSSLLQNAEREDHLRGVTEINFSKSSVTFSRNTDEELCLSVVSNLTIRRDNKRELYLGSQGGMRSSYLMRAKKFSSNRFSKQSRRMRWVASKLTISLLQEIQSMIARFWWNNRGVNKTHWISWNRLCASKLEWGLGFRQLDNFNLAMLAKQFWRIMQHPEGLLSRVLKERYFPTGNVFSTSLGTRPSFTWRSIMAAQDLFRAVHTTWHAHSKTDPVPVPFDIMNRGLLRCAPFVKAAKRMFHIPWSSARLLVKFGGSLLSTCPLSLLLLVVFGIGYKRYLLSSMALNFGCSYVCVGFYGGVGMRS